MSDAIAYRDLMLEAYGVAPDAFTSTPDERAGETPSWWERRIAHPDALSVAFGVFLHETLDGAVSLEYSNRMKVRHKARLVGMYVRPHCRRLGAGRKLLQAALLHAGRREGTETVTLTVTQGNESAIALYRSCGFVEFGLEPMAVRVGGGFKSKVHMYCRLTRGDGLLADGS